ncbi:uncharacterized protein LOC129219594 [Uloborus diversus]|uniref:uncharacterized protein LOC129219594 n=1 Tax=Uloborus diversus TaxID=327109 RepID=UPI002408FBEA|nr:uncharacterized protein LOC129219594 [Uloborus diversus]
MKQFLVFITAAVVFGKVVLSKEDDLQDVVMCAKTLYCNSTEEIKGIFVECLKLHEHQSYSDAILPCHPGAEKFTAEDSMEFLCQADGEELYKTTKCEEEAIKNSAMGEEIQGGFDEAIKCFSMKLDELQDQYYST